jgi:hypothetical protein
MTLTSDTRALRPLRPLGLLVLGSFLACNGVTQPSDTTDDSAGGSGGETDSSSGGKTADSEGGKGGKSNSGGKGGSAVHDPDGSGGTTQPGDTKPDAAPSGTPDATDPGTTPDADVPATDGSAVVDPPPGGGPPTGPFNCTLVIGIASTSQWFGAGFEKLVDNAKWEVIGIHSGFIQGWADPKGAYWNTGPSSACAMNPKNPDRVIMEALWLHWEDATVEQWVPQLVAVVNNIKAKFPAIKRIELSTFPRAPGDKPCPVSMPFKSWIRPEQDEAEEKVAAMFPDLVVAGPKFKVATCADYGGNPPHFSGSGATATAKMIADYYNSLSK